jgi:hypothetical protein
MGYVSCLPRRTALDVMPSGILSAFNPLTLSLRLDAGHASWDMADDPMMVELVASLKFIQTDGALPPMFAAPAKDEAPKPPSSPVVSCGSPHSNGLGLDHPSGENSTVLSPDLSDV